MLILSRKENETIMIGDDIKIALVSLNNKYAVIGINAPKEVEIFRQEIYDRKKLILKELK